VIDTSHVTDGTNNQVTSSNGFVEVQGERYVKHR